jgi:hypothetical protein
MFRQKNTPVQIWNLGILDFRVVRNSLIGQSAGCEAWTRQPRSGLMLSTALTWWGRPIP